MIHLVLAILLLLLLEARADAQLPWSQFLFTTGFWSHIAWNSSALLGTPGSSLSLTVSGTPHVGDCILLSVYTQGTTTITATAGSETFTSVSNLDPAHLRTFALYNTTAAETTINISASAGTMFQAMADEFHYSSANCTSVTGGKAAQNQASTTSPTSTAATAVVGSPVWGTTVEIGGTAHGNDPGTNFIAYLSDNTGFTAAGLYTNSSGTYRYWMATESKTAASTSEAATFSSGSGNFSTGVINISHL